LTVEIEWLIPYLAVNLVGFFAMGMDKWKSQNGGNRLPEKTMILLAVVSGASGILLGMVMFRHKTGKRKFYIGIPCIYVVYRVIIAIGIWQIL